MRSDIELQVFADAFDWNRLEIFDPNERKVAGAGMTMLSREDRGMSRPALLPTKETNPLY